MTRLASPQLDWTEVDRRPVDTVRVLAMDALEKVGNGHPGTARSLDSVIPPDLRARVSIEAGVGHGWRDVVGDAGEIICIEHYSASAAGALLFEKFGFTADAVVAAARITLTAAREPPSAALRRLAHGPVGPAGTG